MFMSPLIRELSSPFPSLDELIFPTLSFRNQMVRPSMSKSKGDGPSMIDVSISLYDSNTQTSTSVSFSRELPTHSVSPVRQLIETFAKGVEEETSKESSGNIQTEESSQKDG